MTEEEFDDYYQRGFRGGRRMNDNNRQNNVRTRFFESYTYQNGRWKETTWEQLNRDIDNLPTLKKDENNLFYWISKQGRDYYVNSCQLVGVLYDHINMTLLYAAPGAVIPHDSVFTSREACQKWIIEEEEKHRGEISAITRIDDNQNNMNSPFGQQPNVKEFTDANGTHFTFTFN